MNIIEGGIFNNKSVWSNVVILLSITTVAIFCVFLSAAFDNIENKRSADFIYKINQQRSIVEHIAVLANFFTSENQEKIGNKNTKHLHGVNTSIESNINNISFDLSHARSEVRDLSQNLELIDLKFVESIEVLPVSIKKFYFDFKDSDIESDNTDIKTIGSSSIHKKINKYTAAANKLSQLATDDINLIDNVNYLRSASKDLTKSLDNSAALYYQYLVHIIQEQTNNHWVYVFLFLILFVIALVFFVVKPVQFSLDYSYKEAALAKRIKTEFLTSVSHEIRTPMHGIISAGENLNSTALDKKQSSYVKTVLSSAESLLDVINDILGYSSLESGDTVVDKSQFNLNELVTDLIQIMSERAQLKKIELILRYEDSVPHEVVGDSSLTRQIFYHLISNAIKFTEKGYIVVTVGIVDSHVNPYFNLKFSIEDTGIGISESNLPLIFEEFMQGDGATTRLFSGTGLGLSICKKMIDLMGGSIRVSSVLGEGSTFSFTLPFEVPKSILPTEEKILTDTRSSVLFVCDDTHLKKELLAEVGMSGFQVNCIDSLSFLNQQPAGQKIISLICIDYFIKNASPTKIMQQAKLSHYYSQVPFICITRQSDELAFTQLKAEGFFDVFSFPSDSKLFLNFMSSAIVGDIKNIHHMKELSVKNDSNNNDVLAGASILLVEDNRINATLAQDMLESLGTFVTQAENGSIALKLIKNGELFDLVLMDCMMPVMDGFKATKEIRQLPQVANQKLPIIALTANAMIGDKERCLSVGMSDYLSKPVRKKDLKSMLVKWLKNRKPSNANISLNIPVKNILNAEDKYPKKPDDQILKSPTNEMMPDFDVANKRIPDNLIEVSDLKVINTISPSYSVNSKLNDKNDNDYLQASPDKPSASFIDYKLEFLDQDIIIKSKKMMKQRFPTMVEYFLEDTQNYINQIREGITQNDYAQLVVPSHTIKSSARQMGAITVSDLAKDIEVFARAEETSFDDFSHMVDELQKQFDLSRIDYNNLLSDV